jgi:membrane protein implicated in regulation of membrane protease activity
MELAWWHWIALGLVLVALEIFVSTFFILWFGLGAVLTGVVLAVLPLSFTVQILLFTASSAVMTFLWFRYFKNPDRTTSGQAKKKALGARGLVTRGVTEMEEGEILFQRPVLGADRWPAVADEPIAAGEKAVVVDVLGQTLKILKTK